ncbi:OLC1v1032610C3 [Oldenlandia corymbosa var. corymbosa]|uniref:OLC1v1032610C3 n=1 Tax=Oldenlandia corymbosa var. corymbosa TaxID=529605 RepID=A0AAV1CM32_OLDCO|nr:OLC1v1032610C3 [Oldenlandia corymbosa var. corymbosa]
MADQESLSVSTPNAKAEMAEDQESLSVSTPNAKAEMAEDQESLSVSTPNAKAEMADQESASTPNAKTVADLFLAQYYEILRNYPDSLHKFYKDGSALKWPGAEFVTTIKGIEETIMASEYKGCEVKIINADAQDSLMEGIVLTVIGCLLGKDNVKKIMLQTFFLAKQGTFGFYVLNDNLCVMNTQEVLNISIASDDVDKSVSVASDVSSAQESGPADVHAEPKIDVPAEPKSVKGSTSTESTDVVEETPDGTVPAAEVPKPVTLTKNVTPANVSDDEKLEGQKLERQKISYASVLAKERKGSSFADNQGHKIVRVAPSSNQQSDVSPKIARVAPSFNQQQSRHFNRANIVRGTKERSFTENNSNIQNNSNNIRSEDSMARSVYMENLPKDITKDELAEAVKVFGLARPSDIQIKTFPRVCPPNSNSYPLLPCLIYVSLTCN